MGFLFFSDEDYVLFFSDEDYVFKATVNGEIFTCELSSLTTAGAYKVYGVRSRMLEQATLAFQLVLHVKRHSMSQSNDINLTFLSNRIYICFPLLHNIHILNYYVLLQVENVNSFLESNRLSAGIEIRYYTSKLTSIAVAKDINNPNVSTKSFNTIIIGTFFSENL